MSDTQGHDGTPEDPAAPRRERHEAPMPGTTHDPNSVTTGTEVEPKGDVFPPPGTRDRS